MESFERIFNESSCILTEGALVERLKTEFNIRLDDPVNHAGLIYNKPKILEKLYSQYIEIANKHNLPIMIMTPTRRVNYESVKDSKFRNKPIIPDACSYLNTIRERYNGKSQNILIGGLLGCKGDAYSGEKKMDMHSAYNFHSKQTVQFQKQKIDFLFAGIMPEINEAVGMARAMAETGIPYIISFMIRKDGCLMDGTVLSEAIKIVDNHVSVKPICFMTNCIHPSNLIEALNNAKNKNSKSIKRFKGIQANASILSPEELNNCNVLQQDDFETMINEIAFLHDDFNLKIVGGCCGTNEKFLENLSEKMMNKVR